MKTTGDVAYLAPELVGRELPSPPRGSRSNDHDMAKQPEPHRHLQGTGYAFWEVMILSAILTFAALTLFGQTYDFSTAPYDHVQDIGACYTYSGSNCISWQQWGFIAINPVNKTFAMRSGIGKQGAPYQQPVTFISPRGDCNISSTKVAASAGALKWVLTSGTLQPCAANSCATAFVETPPGSANWVCGSPRPSQAVQVWKFSNGNWSWAGQVGSDLFLYQHPLVRVVGDFGYMLETHGGIPTPPPVWSKFDLNTLSIIQTGIPEASVPPGEAQDGINGVHYTLSKTGAMAYRLASTGPPPPTVTPLPTPTPTPNQFARYVVWVTDKGIMAGCGGNLFCPGTPVNGLLTRAQYAATAFNQYRVDHPGEPLPVCRNIYSDVVCP